MQCGAALATTVAHRRGSGGSLVAGALLGGALLIGLTIASATVRILLLWNIGVPGALPSVAYGMIGFAVAITAVNALRRGQLSTVAGVTLVAAGGIGLHSTYQSGLAVVGLAVLALRRLLDHEVRPATPTPQPPVLGRASPRLRPATSED